MNRTKVNQQVGPASAILTADFHLAETTPPARTDDYSAAQVRNLHFLQRLSIANGNCPVLCAGDVFHTWRASPWCCLWAYQNLPAPLIAIPGNHDLPMHSLDQYGRSALALLEGVVGETRLRVLKGDSVLLGNLYIVGVPFGRMAHSGSVVLPRTGALRRILMLHERVWANRGEMQGVIGGHTATEILGRFGGAFDLILTGDNHACVVERADTTGSLLVNPGSMMRMTADQDDYQPQCFLYYTETNEVHPVPFPADAPGALSRAHLDTVRERNARIVAYIEQMQKGWGAGLSFRANLQGFFQKNNTPQKIRELIWQHLDNAETRY